MHNLRFQRFDNSPESKSIKSKRYVSVDATNSIFRTILGSLYILSAV